MEFNQAIQDLISHYDTHEKTFKNHIEYRIAQDQTMNIHQFALRIHCMTPEVILETAPLGWIIGAYIATKAYYYNDKQSKYDWAQEKYEFKQTVLTEIERYVKTMFAVDIQPVWDAVMNVTPEKWLSMKKQLGWDW